MVSATVISESDTAVFLDKIMKLCPDHKPCDGDEPDALRIYGDQAVKPNFFHGSHVGAGRHFIIGHSQHADREHRHGDEHYQKPE